MGGIRMVRIRKVGKIPLSSPAIRMFPVMIFDDGLMEKSGGNYEFRGGRAFRMRHACNAKISCWKIPSSGRFVMLNAGMKTGGACRGG